MDDIDSDTLRELAKQRVGTTLREVGRLERLVGVGGMAAVYRVDDEDGEAVAVKLMHEHLSNNTSLRERFLREATILDQVDHPNSVTVYATGENADGEAYFVMELLEGIEVGTVWKRKGTFPTGGALRIVHQVLDCLDAYHRAGVLHRDLKPGNLFLTQAGIVKLIDFGLARYRVEGRATTKKGTALGTPAYMAPEQALGKQEQVDERTDVFGVGATLFALLAGQPLYDIGTADAALVQAATSRPDSLADHAPHLPESVVDLVDRAIAWERVDRFESAAEMRDRVEQLLETESFDRDAEVASPKPPPDQSDQPQRDKVGWVGVMRDFFDDITGILETLRRAPDDETSRQDLKNAFNKVRLAAGRRDEPIAWRILPHSFEMDGQVVWEPEDDLEQVPYNLFDAGFRRIRVDQGLRFGEFVTFVRWLNRESLEALPAAETLATRFRALAFPSIEAEIVDHFEWRANDADRAPGEVYRALAERAVDYLHDSEGMWDGLENLVDQQDETEVGSRRASVSNKIDSLATDFLRSPKGILSKRGASTLYETIRRERDPWEGRFAAVLADIWEAEHGTDRLPVATARELLDHFLDDDRARPFVELAGAVHARLEGEAAGAWAAQVIPEQRLADLVPAILREVGSESTEERTRCFETLSRVIADLPEARRDEIAELRDESSETIREILAPYFDAESRPDEIDQTVEMQGPRVPDSDLRE